MRWEARGVAARLCGVGRPATDRSRRPVRQGPAGASAGVVSRRKQGSTGAASEQSGSEEHGLSQRSFSGAGFLPDLVPSAGRKLRRTPRALTGSRRDDRAGKAHKINRTGRTSRTERTSRIDEGQADDNNDVPPDDAPRPGVSRDRRRRAKLQPAALPTNTSKDQSPTKARRSTPTFPPENYTGSGVMRRAADSGNDVISDFVKPVIRRAKNTGGSLDNTSGKLKPLPPVSASDSEYVHMQPKFPSKKCEYENIESWKSCAGVDSSASCSDLPDPAGYLQAMLSSLRLHSDREGQSLTSPSLQKPGRAALSSLTSSKLSRIKAESIKETMEQNRRQRQCTGSERSPSPGGFGQNVSHKSPEQDHCPRSSRRKLLSSHEFGYDIDNVSSFLSQATARTPANIPMVVTTCTELYLLNRATTPERPTIAIQLGIVVNALFKRRQWLYVQTPHSQEGYLVYSACSALGVLPRRTSASPWDWQRTVEPQPPLPPTAADRGRSWSPPAVLPDPRPNKTDTEKLYENVTSDGRALGLLVQQHVRQQRGQQKARRDPLSPQTRSVRSESSAFRRLRAAEVAPARGKLVAPPSSLKVAPRTNNKAVIWDGFVSYGRNTLTVRRGDIVILLNTSVGGWFWVKDASGREGYIPAVCVGSGLT